MTEEIPVSFPTTHKYIDSYAETKIALRGLKVPFEKPQQHRISILRTVGKISVTEMPEPAENKAAAVSISECPPPRSQHH